MREPESTKTFEESFDPTGMDVYDGMNWVREIFDKLRNEQAAPYVANLFAKHGYFNGEVTQVVTSSEAESRVTVQCVVSCYGRPLRLEPGEGLK